MHDQSTNQSLPGVPGPLAAFGVALILGGCLIALFVARELLGVYQRMDDNSFVGELVSRFKDAEILLFGAEPLLITEQGATIIAIFLFVLLALWGFTSRLRSFAPALISCPRFSLISWLNYDCVLTVFVKEWRANDFFLDVAAGAGKAGGASW